MTIKAVQKFAVGTLASLLVTMTAQGAIAQEATSQEATSQEAATPSGKIAEFNSCIENNASALVPQADLIRLCVNTHSKPLDRGIVRSEGSYRQTENGLIFVLRMQNSSPDTILTGYSVILKHQKAEQPQVFTFSPVSILPGRIIDVPLGGLAYVPEASELESDKFQFGVDGVSGVTLELN